MKKLNIVTLLLLEFLIVFEMSMVMPLAPVIARVYQIPQNYVTWINIGFTISGFFAPLLGRFADKVSMKKTMLIALGCFSLGSLGLALTTSVTGYFIFRFFIGLGYYTLLSLIVSYASITISPASYNIFSGAVKVAFALGVIVAPLLCSWIEITYSYQTIYLMLFVVSLLLSGLLLTMRDAVATAQSADHPQNKIYTDKVIIAMVVACFLLVFPSVYVYSFTSLRLNTLGVDQYTISSIYTVIAVGSLCAGFAIMILGKKLSLYVASLVGIVLVVVSLPFFSINQTLLIIFGFIFGVGYDLLWGCFYPYCARLRPGVSGLFLTLLSLSMAFSNLVNGLIGPLIYENLGYTFGLVLVMISFALAFIILIKTNRMTLQDTE